MSQRYFCHFVSIGLFLSRKLLGFLFYDSKRRIFARYTRTFMCRSVTGSSPDKWVTKEQEKQDSYFCIVCLPNEKHTRFIRGHVFLLFLFLLLFVIFIYLFLPSRIFWGWGILFIDVSWGHGGTWKFSGVNLSNFGQVSFEGRCSFTVCLPELSCNL